MPLPPDVVAADERMKQAQAAVLADRESGEPYNSERRHHLLDDLKRAMDEYFDKISHLRL